jgi:hypothetical protein
MALRPNTVCVHLAREARAIVGVDYVDRVTGERGRLWRDRFDPRGGRARHAAPPARVRPRRGEPGAGRRRPVPHAAPQRVVLGVFVRPPNPGRVFDKQVAIHDFYVRRGDGDPRGTLGGIQQMTPSVGLVRAYVPWLVREPAAARGVALPRGCS